jgi:hypothetical protein
MILLLILQGPPAVAQSENIQLNLELPASSFAPGGYRDAQVLVSTGRLIGGWPAGGIGEHGGYFAFIFVKNLGSEKLGELQTTITVSSPLQFSKYDRKMAWHQPTEKTTDTFKIPGIEPGATARVGFSVSVPQESSVIPYESMKIDVKIANNAGVTLVTQTFSRSIVSIPIFLWWISFASIAILIWLLYYGVRKGFFYGSRFSSGDIILMIGFGILVGGIWQTLIGNFLGFSRLVNAAIPIRFVNTAVADIGWYTLFTLGVLVLRKPGAATIIALFHEYFYGYNFGSVIPFGTGWYLRPFALGLPIDIFLAFMYARNPNLLTENRFSRQGILTAAVIGVMPFTWTLVMHLVYHPSIANMYVNASYQLTEAAIRGGFSVVYAVLLAYPVSILLMRSGLMKSLGLSMSSAAAGVGYQSRSFMLTTIGVGLMPYIAGAFMLWVVTGNVYPYHG